MKKNDTPLLSDFPEFIQKGFINSEEPDIASIKEKIEENFKKNTISEELYCNSMEIVDSLEKGKRAEIGETREWSDKKYQKDIDGWHIVTSE